MSKVQEAITEIEAELAELTPQLEGHYDFRRLNVQPATLAEVNASIEQYERRLVLLNSALAALTALVGDGYPELLPNNVTAEVMADLQYQLQTITAAIGTYTAEPATSLGLSAGAPEPK